jgi:hypothetical protein
MRLTVLTFFLLLTLTMAGGCGIKPGNVDAPPGTQKDSFPKTYPDPATDPHP